MTDDEKTPWERHAMQLDDAVNSIDDDGFITSGWVVIRVSNSIELEAGESAYSYYMPLNQPIHVTRGLIDMARTNFDERCRSVIGE